MDNNKLIGQLTIGLSKLKTDINDANKELSKIDASKLDLKLINTEEATKAINILKLMKTEIDGMSKVGVNTSQIDTFIKSLTTALKTVNSEVTKVTNKIVKDTKDTIDKVVKITESVDSSGTKHSATSELNKKTDNTITTATDTTDYKKLAKDKQKDQLETLRLNNMVAKDEQKDNLETLRLQQMVAKDKQKDQLETLRLNNMVAKDEQKDNLETLRLQQMVAKDKQSKQDSVPKSEITAVQSMYSEMKKDNELSISNLKLLSGMLDEVNSKYTLSAEDEKTLLGIQAKYTTEINSQIAAQKKNSGQNTKAYLESYKSQLDSVDKEYLQLNSTESKRITDLNDLATKTRTLATELGLEGKAWNEAETKAKWFEAEASKITVSINKISDATEKQSLAELKLFTQEKANSQEYSNMSKTLSQISGESLPMSSSNYNNTMVDRFKVSTAYAVASQSIYMVRTAFNDAIQTNRDYESSLVDLRRVLGDVTDNDLKAYGAQAVQLAKDFGEPLKEVQSTYSALAAAGIQNKEDLNSMAKTVSMGLNTSDIKDGAQLTDLLTSSMKQLGIATSDSEKVLDSWNYLADKHIAKTSDFAEATSKAGMASKAMGIDINHLNAMVAVLSDNTGVSGSQIGDAVKSMENKLLRPESLKTLKEYGVEVMADATHFKSFGEIITNVSTVLDKFGENTIQSNKILDALGGTMRKNWVTILAANQGKIDTVAQQSAIDSIGYSATKSSATMDTLEKKVQQFNATIKEFYISTGNSGILGQLKGIVDFGTKLAGAGSWMAPLLLRLGETAILVKTISGTLSVIKGQNLTQILDKINVPEFNIGGANFGGATTSVKAYESAVGSLSQQITNGNISFKESQTILAVVGEKIGLATSSTDTFKASEEALNDVIFANEKNQVRATELLTELNVEKEASSVTNKGAIASETALNSAQKATAASALGLKLAMVGITVGLTLAISGLIALVTWLSKADERQQKLLQDGVDAAKKYSDETKSIQDLVAQYKELSASGKTDADTKKQLLDIQSQLVSSYGDEAKNIDLVNGGYQDQIDKLQKLNKSKADKYIDENQKANNEANDVLTEKSTFKVSVPRGGNIEGIVKNNADNIKASAESVYYSELSINGTLEERIKILTQILHSNGDIAKQTDLGKKDAGIISDEIKRLNGELDNAKDITQKMFNAKLISSHSEELGKLTKYTTDYQKAMKGNDTAGAKKASESYTSLYSSMENTLSAAPELRKAFESYATTLDKTGDSAKEAGTQVENTSEKLKEITKSFDDSTESISSYNKFMDDYTKNGHFSAETVKEIIDKHQELAPYLKDEKTLYAKLSEALNTEKETANKAYREMMVNSNEYYNANIKGTNTIKTALGSYYNDLTKAQQDDLANSKSLAEAKAKVESALISDISKMWADYFDAQAVIAETNPIPENDDGRMEDLQIKLTNRSLKGSQAMNAIKNSAKNITEMRNAINSSFDSISANIVAPNISSYGSSSDTDKGTKTGSNALEKQENEALVLKDRYYALNEELTKTQNLIDTNNALQSDADINNNVEEKIKLQKQEIELLKQKQVATKNIQDEQQKEREETARILRSKGVTFDGIYGNTTPLNAQIILQQKLDAMNAHRNDSDKTYYNQLKTEYEDYNTVLERFFTLENTELPKSKASWQSLASEISKTSKTINDEATTAMTSFLQIQQKIDEIKMNQKHKDEQTFLAKTIYGTSGSDADTVIKAYNKANQLAQDGYQNQIDNLNEVNDIQTEIETRLKNQNDLIEKRTILENAQKNLTTQTISKNADGTFQFKYVADASAVESAQKAYDDQITSNNDWEKSTALKKTTDALAAKKKALADEKTTRDTAYNDQLTALKNTQTIETNLMTLHYSDMNILAKTKLDELVETYKGDWSKIITQLTADVATATTLQNSLALTQAQGTVTPYVYGGGASTASENTSGSSSRITGTVIGSHTTEGKTYITVLQPNGNTASVLKGTNGFSEGGETQTTGMHLLHGKTGEPERVLSSTQTSSFDELVTYLPSTLTAMSDIMDKIDMSNVSNNNTKSGDMIFQFGDLTLPNIKNAEDFTKGLQQLAWQKIREK